MLYHDAGMLYPKMTNGKDSVKYEASDWKKKKGHTMHMASLEKAGRPVGHPSR